MANVLDEMEELYDRYRFRSLVFHDDQFVIRPGWVEDFCAGLHRHGFVERGIRWWAASRSDVICRHPELIAAMRDAGLTVISIGFESFSDRMLEWMQKETTGEENLRAAAICHDLGLTIFANVILGLPYSDGVWYRADDEASLAAVRQIRPKHFSPSFFDPIPGSWLYDWTVERGLLIAERQPASGDRRPEQAKVMGVDYGWLSEQLDAYRRGCEPSNARSASLRQRVQRFASKPLSEKVDAVRRRLNRLVPRR